MTHPDADFIRKVAAMVAENDARVVGQRQCVEVHKGDRMRLVLESGLRLTGDVDAVQLTDMGVTVSLTPVGGE